MNVDSGFQISDFKSVVRRRAKVALGVALGVSLVGYWVAMALPNEYKSFATVLVEPQTVDPRLVESGLAQADINRRLHIMAAQILSRSRLSRIIDELGLYEDESNYLVRDEIVNLMREAIMVEPVLPELQQAAGTVPRDLVIDQFRINFRDDDPEVARDVAQRLANDFIEEHIATRVRTSQKSVEFVEAELDRLAQSIGQIESQVADFKAANSGRLPEDFPANARRMERLSMEAGDLRREVATARSDEAFFRSQSATAREMSDGFGGDRPDSPQTRVRMLELAMADFEARGFTDKHPDVVKTEAELEALKAQIKATGESEDAPVSFAAMNAQAEAERARLRRFHAEEELTRIIERLEHYQGIMASTPQVAETLDAMEREYKHLFESFQDFSNRRLEATVQADLERRQLGEQFRVLEAAFVALEPISPNRPVIITIAVIFGFALGMGIGFLLEAADPTIHNARQLQTSFNLPVLVAIPEIWLESDRMKQRRSRIKNAAATVAIVLFALVGGAANYWWVNVGGGVEEEIAVPDAAAPAGKTSEAVDELRDTPGGEG